jgi:hypothetical protein
MTDLELFRQWCKDKGHSDALKMIRNWQAMRSTPEYLALKSKDEDG